MSAMGAKIATAYVEMRADTDKARREAREGFRAAAQEATKSFAQFFSAAVFVDQIGKAVSAASNLEQAVGGSQAVFKASQRVVQDFASTSAESFGISQRAALELTTGIGNLLRGLGFTEQEAATTSVTIARLGADLSAAFGGKPEEAVQALGAAFRGEYDPLERYVGGISAATVATKAVELGLASSTTAVDANARAQATLALLTERTADVQGQAGREADTAAGQQVRLQASFEDLRAELGTQLLPVFSRAVDLLSGLVDGFATLPGPVQTAVVALGGIAVLAGPIKNVASVFGGLSKAIRNVGPQALATGAVLATALAVYDLYASRKQKVTDATDAFAAALEAESSGQRGAVAAAIAAQVATEDFAAAAEAAGFTSRDIARYIKGETVPAIDELISKAEITSGNNWLFGDSATARTYEVQEALGITTEQAKELVNVLKAGREGYATATTQQQLLTDVTTELGGATEQTAAATEAAARTTTGWISTLDPLGTALGIAATGADDASGNFDDMRSAQEKAAEAATELAAALNEAFGPGLDLQGAVDAVAENTAALDERIRQAGEGVDGFSLSLDNATESGRANRAAIRDSVAGIQEYAASALEAGVANSEVENTVALLRQGLIDQATQLGLTQEEAAAYVDQLGLTPSVVDTAVQLQGDEAAKARIQEVIDRLGGIPEEERTALQPYIDMGAYAYVEGRLNALAQARRVSYIAATNASRNADIQIGQSSAGRFVRGGSNFLSTLGELSGSRGDEVVLPLGDLPRMRDLLAMPEVGGRVASAMGGGGVPAVVGGGSTTFNINASGGRELPGMIRREIETILWQQRLAASAAGSGS